MHQGPNLFAHLAANVAEPRLRRIVKAVGLDVPVAQHSCYLGVLWGFGYVFANCGVSKCIVD